MRRPHWHSAMFTVISGVIGLAILAGCTTPHSGLSAKDEAAQYLRNARGRYVIPGPPGDPWGPYIHEASKRFDIPDQWIRALMRQESGGNLYRNGRLITSSAGAMGLMQVMPGTYAGLRSRYNLGPDPFDPRDNILAGVGYMREMYDMYGSPGFLAAYNAGPNRLDDYLANQRSLPDETRRYVAAIGPSLRSAQPRVRSPAEQFAINQLPLHIASGPRFGYGAAQVPTIQLAAASAPPVYSAPAQPVYSAPAQPVYSPPAQPRVVAYAQPQPVGRTLSWDEPQRPAPVQRVVTARVQEEPAPVHRARAAQPTRVAMAIRPASPSRRGGGLHLISSAVAAEVYTSHHGRKTNVIPVSYTRPIHGHAAAAKPHNARTQLTHKGHGRAGR